MIPLGSAATTPIAAEIRARAPAVIGTRIRRRRPGLQLAVKMAHGVGASIRTRPEPARVTAASKATDKVALASLVHIAPSPNACQGHMTVGEWIVHAFLLVP